MVSAVRKAKTRSSRPGNRATAAALCFALISFAGCEASPVAKSAITGAFEPIFPVNPVVPTPEPSVGCYAERYTQPEAVITKKLDLLIMIDTSDSLNDEREKVANGLFAFIRALPADVDFRVATMLAHGGGSSWAGRIYSKRRTGAAKVLRSDELAIGQINAGLRQDLTGPATDSGSDGGEIGTYSLTRALDDDRLAESRSLGFFREDAALVVVFVSDENDICSPFPAGYAPVRDPQGSEASAKRRYCTRTAPPHVVNGVTISPSFTETITPESVVRKLLDLQNGRPLVVSAIAYTDRVNYPHDGENEYGYGWLDMVELANGVKVEMTDASYDEGLERIGSLATVKLSLNKDFSLTHRSLDPSTIAAKVDGESVGFTYIPAMNQVSLESLGNAGSTIDLTYCEPKPAPSPEPSPSVTPSPEPSPSPSATPSPEPSPSPSAIPSPEPSPEPSPTPAPSPTPVPSPTPTGVAGVDALCQAGAFVPKMSLVVGITIDPGEGSMSAIQSGLSAMGISTTAYTDAQIAADQPTADGVTVLIISRKVVLAGVDAAYVAGIRSFIAHGGSIFAEYDGAGLLFDRYAGLNVAFDGHFTPSVGLFAGNVAGGGLLLPSSFSSVFIVDPSHPIMLGVPTPLSSGIRAAFAVTEYPTTWLSTLGTFTASGSTGSIPAGSFPAVLAGRCGGGRVAILPMNHLSAVTDPNVVTLVRNAMNWLIGQ